MPISTQHLTPTMAHELRRCLKALRRNLREAVTAQGAAILRQDIKAREHELAVLDEVV